MPANKYPGDCRRCSRYVAANAGARVLTEDGWRVECLVPECTALPTFTKPAKPAATTVGDVTGILALFDRAKQHLKFPAIWLGVPALGDFAVRINVAGATASVPGSLTVLTEKRDVDGKRAYLGRITLDGAFRPSTKAGPYAAAISHVAARLRDLAADPARVAGEHGRLHGRCCFCRLPLKDERSTAVGYGETCAGHFGLPWGSRPEQFAGEAA